MPNVAYLCYPDLETLMRAGASRDQFERSLASYAYVQLCRQTLQDSCGVNLSQHAFIMTIGSDKGAINLATVLAYLVAGKYQNTSELNGPILSLAYSEADAFQEWLGYKIPKDISKVNMDPLTQATSRWLADLSPHAPRTLWFSETINSSTYSKLRADLVDWKVASSYESNKATELKSQAPQSTTRFVQSAGVPCEICGRHHPSNTLCYPYFFDKLFGRD